MKKLLFVLALFISLFISACSTVEANAIEVFDGEEVFVQTLYESDNFVIGSQTHDGERYLLFNTEDGYVLIHEDDVTVVKSDDAVKIYQSENGYVFNWPRGTFVSENYNQ